MIDAMEDLQEKLETLLQAAEDLILDLEPPNDGSDKYFLVSSEAVDRLENAAASMKGRG